MKGIKGIKGEKGDWKGRGLREVRGLGMGEMKGGK